MPTVTLKLTDEENAAVVDLLAVKRTYRSRSDLFRTALLALFKKHKVKRDARAAMDAARSLHRPRRRRR